MFNPWAQCSVGQAQILIGLVLLFSVHGFTVYPFFRTAAPVWAGVVVSQSGTMLCYCTVIYCTVYAYTVPQATAAYIPIIM